MSFPSPRCESLFGNVAEAREITYFPAPNGPPIMNVVPLLSLFSLSLVGACHSTPEHSEVPFERMLSGQLGLSQEAKNAVVKSAEEWRALFRTSGPGIEPPPLDIDWSKKMLIAVSLGSRPSGGYAVAIDSLSLKDSHWVVHARESRPAKDSLQTTMITAPFDCVATARFDGRVDFIVE